MAMKIETVKTDSFSMDFFRFGRGERTLVILPGLSIKSVMISAMLVAKEYEVFVDDFTVYVFDRRAELPESYPIREMARDTAQAMLALGLEDICLFGASQGGMMAMLIAAQYPHLVRKLALGSTAARISAAEYEALGEWMKFAGKGDRVGLYLAFGEAIYPPAVFEQYRGELKMIAGSVTDEELSRFIVLCEGTKDLDATADLAAITCPTLAIAAADDRVIGADAGRLIAQIMGEKSGFEYYEYDGYGHAVFDTAPDYRERLYRFFRG